MSSESKPISGLWVGMGEFFFFLLCIAAAAVPYADRYNREDKMVITIAMGIAAIIVVFIFSKIFNKRTAKRGDFAPAQQGMLTVRDRSVALALMAGAGPVGMSLGTASLARGRMADQMLTAAIVGLVIVLIIAAITSRFWGAFNGQRSVGGGILAALATLGALYGAKAAWEFSGALGQMGLSVSGDAGIVKAAAGFLVIANLITAAAFAFGAKILFSGSSTASDYKPMISLLGLGYLVLAVATVVSLVMVGIEAKSFNSSKKLEVWLQVLMGLGNLPLAIFYFTSGRKLKSVAEELSDSPVSPAAEDALAG